jgi:hypothetical protein
MFADEYPDSPSARVAVQAWDCLGNAIPLAPVR